MTLQATSTTIDTAVIPVAGLGTRMGTFTEGVPKFMTPVYAGDEAKPAIDFMIDECLGAGVQNFVFVTSDGGDKILKKYLEHLSPSREAQLIAQIERDPKKKRQLEKELTRRESFSGMNIVYLDQPVGPYGTAVPLALARDILKGVDRFIVTGGDDFIWHPDGHSEWADALAGWDGKGSIIMGDAVAPEHASKYGILQDDGSGNLAQIIEKPAAYNVPENPVRNISRYIAGPDLWPHLEAEMRRLPDAGQPEHYVTDVINAAVAAGAMYKIHRITGTYFDCGTPRSTQHAGMLITAELDKLKALSHA
jgi:UTP--glucose-1-phosphate uridylyltransferase